MSGPPTAEVRVFLPLGETVRILRAIACVAIRLAESAGADPREVADLRRWVRSTMDRPLSTTERYCK